MSSAPQSGGSHIKSAYYQWGWIPFPKWALRRGFCESFRWPGFTASLAFYSGAHNPKGQPKAMGHWAADAGAGTQAALARGVPVSVLSAVSEMHRAPSLHIAVAVWPQRVFLELVWQHLSESVEQPGLG